MCGIDLENELDWPVEYVSISGNSFYGNKNAAVMVHRGSSDTLIENNTITGYVALVYGENTTVSGNTVKNGGIYSVDTSEPIYTMIRITGCTIPTLGAEELCHRNQRQHRQRRRVKFNYASGRSTATNIQHPKKTSPFKSTRIGRRWGTVFRYTSATTDLRPIYQPVFHFEVQQAYGDYRRCQSAGVYQLLRYLRHGCAGASVGSGDHGTSQQRSRDPARCLPGGGAFRSGDYRLAQAAQQAGGLRLAENVTPPAYRHPIFMTPIREARPILSESVFSQPGSAREKTKRRMRREKDLTEIFCRYQSG